MKESARYLVLIFICSLVWHPSIAQITNDSNCPDIFEISDEDLVSILHDQQSACRGYWLDNSDKRHAVIQRLDDIFVKQFSWWLDKNAFLEHLDSVASKTANSIERSSFLELLELDSFPSKASFDKKMWKTHRDQLFFKEWELLYTFLEIDHDELQEARVSANLSWVNHHQTLQYLKEKVSINSDFLSNVSGSVKTRNEHLIAERLAIVEDEEFIMYKSNGAKRDVIKDLELFMDNDNLMILPGLNEDRNYTGGGSFSISTDYLDTRFINLSWLRNIGKNNNIGDPHRIVMGYQSLRAAMHIFTPYIRYRNNFDFADSAYQHDRPFGSYVYMERNKFRLWPKGLVRSHGSLQIGKIGTEVGKDIQGILHRDAGVEAQKVHGWSTQIANGGRWLAQMSYNVDLLLFSTTNKYKSIFAPHKSQNLNRRGCWNYWGINLVSNAKVMAGGYLTGAEAGIRLSSTDFTNISGENSLKVNKKSLYNFGFNWEIGASYRYVHHNSMLEGFGYFSTWVDDKYDDEAQSVYVLNQEFYETQDVTDKGSYERPGPDDDQVNRHLLILDFKLNVRWQFVQFYYQMTLHSKEFRKNSYDLSGMSNLVAPEDIDYFDGKVSEEQQSYASKDYYGFGRVGIVWVIDSFGKSRH